MNMGPSVVQLIAKPQSIVWRYCIYTQRTNHKNQSIVSSVETPLAINKNTNVFRKNCLRYEEV